MIIKIKIPRIIRINFCIYNEEDIDEIKDEVEEEIIEKSKIKEEDFIKYEEYERKADISNNDLFKTIIKRNKWLSIISEKFDLEAIKTINELQANNVRVFTEYALLAYDTILNPKTFNKKIKILKETNEHNIPKQLIAYIDLIKWEMDNIFKFYRNENIVTEFLKQEPKKLEMSEKIINSINRLEKIKERVFTTIGNVEDIIKTNEYYNIEWLIDMNDNYIKYGNITVSKSLIHAYSNIYGMLELLKDILPVLISDNNTNKDLFNKLGLFSVFKNPDTITVDTVVALMVELINIYETMWSDLINIDISTKFLNVNDADIGSYIERTINDDVRKISLGNREIVENVCKNILTNEDILRRTVESRMEVTREIIDPILIKVELDSVYRRILANIRLLSNSMLIRDNFISIVSLHEKLEKITAMYVYID